MIYLSVQFKTKVVFKKAPWTILEHAESVGVADALPRTYVIEDDGPDHVRVSQEGHYVRVPWSNIAAAAVDMKSVSVVVPIEPPKAEPPITITQALPLGFPPLPRKTKR